jgi:hypothetical protein
MATATSSFDRRRRRHRTALTGPVVLGLAALTALVGCSAATSSATRVARAGSVPPVHSLAAQSAPPGWHQARLPDGAAVLAFPPSMHLIAGDAGEVSAARLSAAGAFLLYLNSTPKQGAETLANWPAFRVRHQRGEDASSVRMLAASHGVRFLGGTGTCVVDAYVTRVHANHFTELACFVRGRTGASVIVAAAPTASWASAAGLLFRAVAAYRVR